MIKHTSLADQVFEKLESDILSGKYARGTIMTEGMISDDLQVSRTPVREALQRLEQEHLVRSVSKGVEILSLTIEDALIIYSFRERIEGLAAAACARNITAEQIDELEELLDLQTFYNNKGDTEKVKTYDSLFHRKLYEFAGSPVYPDILSPLHNKIQKFRKSAISTRSNASNSCAEHREILESIKSGDENKAFDAMSEHIRKARIRLENSYAAEDESK